MYIWYMHFINRTSTPYHHVLSLGESTGIGVRTLMQQEGQVLSMAAANKDLSPEHVLQLKVIDLIVR